MADFDPEFSYDDPDVPKGEDADKYTRCAPQRCSAHRIRSSGTRRAGGTHCRRRIERRSAWLSRVSRTQQSRLRPRMRAARPYISACRTNDARADLTPYLEFVPSSST